MAETLQIGIVRQGKGARSVWNGLVQRRNRRIELWGWGSVMVKELVPESVPLAEPPRAWSEANKVTWRLNKLDSFCGPTVWSGSVYAATKNFVESPISPFCTEENSNKFSDRGRFLFYSGKPLIYTSPVWTAVVRQKPNKSRL